MEVIKIGTRFRVVTEEAMANEAGSTAFEEQTHDATGKSKWDPCQRVERGNITLPFLLVVELVRVLQAHHRGEQQRKLRIESNTAAVLEKVRQL